MHQTLKDLVAFLSQTGLTTTEGFPDAPAPFADTPAAAVTLEKIDARAAGLGEGESRLCRLIFGVTLAHRTAEGCLKAFSRLAPLLPGLTVDGTGAAFDSALNAYVLRCRLPKTVWLTEAPEDEDAPALVFDWKGEIIHECHP